MLKEKGRSFRHSPHRPAHLGTISRHPELRRAAGYYECVYCIVDIHALTTVEDTENLRQNTYDMALDLLAAGIRPEETSCRSVACAGSDELHTIFRW